MTNIDAKTTKIDPDMTFSAAAATHRPRLRPPWHLGQMLFEEPKRRAAAWPHTLLPDIEGRLRKGVEGHRHAVDATAARSVLAPLVHIRRGDLRAEEVMPLSMPEAVASHLVVQVVDEDVLVRAIGVVLDVRDFSKSRS